MNFVSGPFGWGLRLSSPEAQTLEPLGPQLRTDDSQGKCRWAIFCSPPTLRLCHAMKECILFPHLREDARFGQQSKC